MTKRLPERLFPGLVLLLAVLFQTRLLLAQVVGSSTNPDFRSSCDKDPDVEALQNKVLYGYPEMEPCYKIALIECQLRGTDDPQKKASLQVEENGYLAEANNKRIGCSSQKKSPKLDILISREYAGGLHIEKNGDSESCITGYLAINGNTVGYTLERPDRNNQKDISSIPAGKYDATLQFEGQKGPYKNEGYRITLLGVPGDREGVQIHIGQYPKNSTGCILVGTTVHANTCTLFDSRGAYQKLKKAIQDQAEADANAAEKKITVTIQNTGRID